MPFHSQTSGKARRVKVYWRHVQDFVLYRLVPLGKMYPICRILLLITVFNPSSHVSFCNLILEDCCIDLKLEKGDSLEQSDLEGSRSFKTTWERFYLSRKSYYGCYHRLSFALVEKYLITAYEAVHRYGIKGILVLSCISFNIHGSISEFPTSWTFFWHSYHVPVILAQEMSRRS